MENKLLLLVFSALVIVSCEKKELPNIDENSETNSLVESKSASGSPDSSRLQYSTVNITYGNGQARKERDRLCFTTSLGFTIVDIIPSLTNPNQEILKLYYKYPVSPRPTTGNHHADDEPAENGQNPNQKSHAITNEEVILAASKCHIPNAILLDFIGFKINN